MSTRAFDELVDAIEIVAGLKKRSFSWTSEADLQNGVAIALGEMGIHFEREVVLGPGSRVDFLVGSIAVELKVDGSLTAVTRQLHRYALIERVGAVVLVTTRSQHRNVPSELGGKPCFVVYLSPI